MVQVLRFALSSARDVDVSGVGRFVAGFLDIDANNTAAIARARYLVQPYRAVELGFMDSTTTKPTLPAVAGPPAPDPYPQYLTLDELGTKADLVSGKVPDAQLPTRLGNTELRAALVPKWKPSLPVLAGEQYLSPTGVIIARIADGTTRSTYDSTEVALWTAASGGGAVSSVAGRTGAVTLTAADITTGTFADAQIPASIARDSEVASAVAALVASAPTTLDTLGELAAALQADESAAAALATLVGTKLSPLTPTATKTAPYTAAVRDLAIMNVAGGGTPLTLPTAPANQSQVGVRALGSTTAAPLTIARGGSDTIGESGATSVIEPLAGVTRIYQYDAPNTRWLPIADVKPLTALDGRYVSTVNYAGDLNAARPAGAGTVYWAGFPTTPTNATDNDIVPVISGADVDTGIRTFDFTPAVGGSTMAFANRMAFHRVRGTGTITKIGLHVITQSGNVCVSVYRNTGVGAAAAPGVLLGSSGSVACPATGYSALTLTGGAVTVLPGDWLAIWTDNTTASFMAVGSAQDGSAKWAGLHAFQDTVTPNPTPAAPTVGLIRGFNLNGVA